ncbi:hypothetical protein [Roseospira visakhapatnamensis]|uniref:Uncharacterized protein n=1 Tax=Roseospira visakhapatnamensis TaxID=390880 RepID=A0A7W6RAS7_9PROT|nr:hypothetical protein [Roseospira visakhapatnamensis]MBB4265103.1 hypothetical protein [Roseospira visakhapatnamensis]
MVSGSSKSDAASMGMAAKVGALLMFATGLFLFLPTVLLVTVAMLPTGVALVVDRSASRTGWLCVGGLNFAGLAPALFELWFEGHTLERAIAIMTDVFTMMLILGAAAVGWVVFLTTPQIIGAFVQMTSDHRIAKLKAQQQQLVEDWGPEVARDEVD